MKRVHMAGNCVKTSIRYLSVLSVAILICFVFSVTNAVSQQPAQLHSMSGGTTDELDEIINVYGVVYSADTPDLPVPGAVVQIPGLGLFDVTDEEGEYILEGVEEGIWDMVITHIPDGSWGYHGIILNDVEIFEENVPLNLYMPEILPPQDLVVMPQDEEAILIWEPPANHEDARFLLETTIEQYRNVLRLINEGSETGLRQKKQTLEQELARLEQEYDRHATSELDNMEDFVGYRIKVIVNNNEIILPDLLIEEEYTATGLTNGVVYGFSVAADYGYNEHCLVWSDVELARPLPVDDDYTWEEIEFEWVDIVAVGTAIDGTGDDGGAGPFDIGFTFPFFGEYVTQFWVNSNGFINFNELHDGGYLNDQLPNSNPPNNAIYLLWDDLHERGGTIYYYHDEENNLTRIQYENWGHYSQENVLLDAQIVLYSDGRIDLLYEDASEDYPFDSETVGIENSDGTEALSISYMNVPEDFPHPELGIRIEASHTVYALLEGVVIDYPTEDGVPGVSVEAVDSNDNHWFGETDEFGYYGVLVVRDGVPFDVTFSKQGYEDSTVTDVTLGNEFETQLDMVLVPWGSIWGYVYYSDTEEAAEGAVVQVLDENDDIIAVTLADEEGWYGFMQMFEDRTQSYRILAFDTGYEVQVSEELTWDIEGDVFYIQYDIALVGIGPWEPRILYWDDDFDDGALFHMCPPGGPVDNFYFQYDDGEIANVHTLTPEDNDEAGYIGVRFYSDGPTIILAGEIRLAIETDPWGAWPDGENQPVLLMLFEFDEETELPEETPLFTSIPVSASEDNPFVFFYPDMSTESDFLIAAVHTVYGEPREGFCVDGSADINNAFIHTTALDGWSQAEFTGDLMFRAWGYTVSIGNPEENIGSIPVNPNNVPAHDIRFSDARLEQPFWYSSLWSPAGNSGYQPASSNELDEFIGYNVYVSTDNETFMLANEETVEENIYFAYYGSEWENHEVYAYLTAIEVIQGDTTEYWQSQVENIVFNMMPASPENFICTPDHENLSVDLTWDAPTTNQDGTELIDLAGFNIYRNSEIVGTVGADATVYVDVLDHPMLCLYAVSAFDEVPNESIHTIPIEMLVGEPDFATGFEPDEFILFEEEGIWAYGEPGGELGEAHSPPCVWATGLEGDYSNNADDYLTSTLTFPILSEQALLSYWHWFDYELRWDGYNVEVSIDEGENWELLEPIGGYPYELIQLEQGGWTGSSNGWMQVIYPLGEFVGEEIMFRLHHTSDAAPVWNYYGVAIDDLMIFGCNGTMSGSLEGTVTDCDGEVVEDATVRVIGTPFFTETDENGFYHIDEIYQGTRDVEVTHDSYWPMTIEDVTITPDQTTTLDFEDLEYPEGEPSANTLEIVLYLYGAGSLDSINTLEFDLHSVGCGPLQWEADLDVVYEPWEDLPTQARNHPPLVPGEQSYTILDSNFTSPEMSGPTRPQHELDELWDVLVTYMELETELGTNGIIGCAFSEDYMYISSFISGQFYVCDFDGNLVEAVDLPGNMDGLIDLSYYDGYLYGVSYFGDHGIYRWEHNDFAGAENLYTVPANMGIGCAYDWDNGWFYFSEWNSIGRWNENTGVAETVPVPDSVSDIMGLSYCPADPDDFSLWVFTQQGGGAVMYRTNPETGEADEGTTLQAAILAGGFNIGDDFDEETWAVQCTFQGTPDFVEVYEGYPAGLPWLLLEPEEGFLESGEAVNISLTADISGERYPAENPGDIEVGMIAEAEIDFTGSFWQGELVTVTVYLGHSSPEAEGEIPTEYALHQNIPNPFNPTTRILFDLVEAQDVRLTVYNILGQEVARLIEEPMQAGYHEVIWDASAMASGVYFYRIETQAFTSMKKMVLVK